MYPMVQEELTRQAELEARRKGARSRQLREATEGVAPGRSAASADIAIHEARAADMPALMLLAELDSRKAPTGRVLIARADGQIRAAIGVDDGKLIADPFVATRPIEDLLRLRVRQIHEWRARGRRGLLGGLLSDVHVRLGRAAQ
jgi:hypothetical protein